MSTNRNSTPNNKVVLISRETTSNIEHIVRPSTPDTECSICLDDLNNTCHTNACMHSFCYDCLKRWSNTAHFCPLCMKNFSHIHHSFDGLGSFETFSVAVPPPPPDNVLPSFEEFIAAFGESLNHGILRTVLSLNDLDDVEYHNINGINQIYHRVSPQTRIIGQARRRQVYATDAWAVPLPNTTGRDCSLAFYQSNPTETHRLHLFVLRDVVAIRQALTTVGWAMPYPGNADITVTNLIMRSLIAYDIRHLYLLRFLWPFMESHLEHFCHELYHFARSPYDIFDYDRNVQHIPRPHRELTEPLPTRNVVNEAIASDANNEEVQRPNTTEVITISSGSDDSDVEILSESSSSIESLNSASIDQPSSSTRVQDSLNRLNNTIRFVYNESSAISYPFYARKRRYNFDSSSSDEDS